MQENDNGRHFPLFGICQGFEILHLLANNDDFADTMTNVDIYSQSRRLTFMDLEPKTSSRLLFKDFPEELLEKMAARNLALHAHDWVISIDAYNRKQQLRDFYKILATDTFVDPLKDH